MFIEAPEFVNREREIRELKAILSGRPNLVYFVYGPINSGKTALLMKVFNELPPDYIVFYINFRARHVANFIDLLKVLFEVRYGERRKKVSQIVKEFLKTGAKTVEKFKGIPVPEKIFDYLFADSRKIEDIFKYLEEVFEEIVIKGYRPVLVFDEMQVIKEVVNEAGRPVLSELFNFGVRITKETHLCHVLCATSDCLFIDMVYSNARLEGRARYFLVDDLDRDEALKVYPAFGFEDKESVWDYIGGNFGDIIILFEEKKRGYPEKVALQKMLKDEIAKLEEFIMRLKKVRKKVIFEGEEIPIDAEGLIKNLKVFKKEERINTSKIDLIYRNFLIEQNILFYNPLEGTVRPQSRLLWNALKEVL